MPPYFSRLGVAENERLGSAPADRAAAAASVPSSTFSCRLLNFPFLNAFNRNELSVVFPTTFEWNSLAFTRPSRAAMRRDKRKQQSEIVGFLSADIFTNFYEGCEKSRTLPEGSAYCRHFKIIIIISRKYVFLKKGLERR